MTETDVIGQLRAQAEAADIELAVANGEIQRLNGALTASEASRAQLRDQVGALDAECRKLQVAFEEALNGAPDVDGVPSAAAEASGLRAALADVRGERADLRGQVEYLEGQVRRLSVETAEAVAVAETERLTRAAADSERSATAAALNGALTELGELPARAVRVLEDEAEQTDRFDTAPVRDTLLEAARLVQAALAGVTASR